MKHILLVLLFAVAATAQISAQRKSNDIDTDEMQEKMEDAMTEIQSMLDTLDFGELFSQDISKMFGGSLEGLDLNNLDSLGNISLDEIFGDDLFKQFGESMPKDLDMDNLGQMMQESLKMLEQMDMTELQEMFEGFNFNFEEFEKMMPSEEEQERDENGKLKKKSKLKKI